MHPGYVSVTSNGKDAEAELPENVSLRTRFDIKRGGLGSFIFRHPFCVTILSLAPCAASFLGIFLANIDMSIDLRYKITHTNCVCLPSPSLSNFSLYVYLFLTLALSVCLYVWSVCLSVLVHMFLLSKGRIIIIILFFFLRTVAMINLSLTEMMRRCIKICGALLNLQAMPTGLLQQTPQNFLTVSILLISCS
jgi:hypothetical protein